MSDHDAVEVDNILRSLSHDFREPLRSIRWYARKCQEDPSVVRSSTALTKLERLDAVVQTVQQQFQELYEAYKQTAEISALRTFVTSGLRASIQSILDSWADLRPHVRAVSFAGKKGLSIDQFAAIVARLPRRYDGLLEYMNVARSLSLTSFGLHKEAERALNDLIALSEGVLSQEQVSIEGAYVGAFDQALIGHMFQNLLANSIKYRQTDAPLSITIKIAARPAPELAPMAPPGMRAKVAAFTGTPVYITYEDNGRGIPVDYHDAVFEPFVQVPDAAPAPGSGMGLAIVKSVVERHGGFVALTSLPGKGTKFWIVLPEPPHGAHGELDKGD